jgi:hypothetical protein
MATDKSVVESATHLENIAEGLKANPPPEEQQSVWQEIKSNPRVIAYTLLANSGSLAFGFDILVTATVPALPAFSYDLFFTPKIRPSF